MPSLGDLFLFLLTFLRGEPVVWVWCGFCGARSGFMLVMLSSVSATWCALVAPGRWAAAVACGWACGDFLVGVEIRSGSSSWTSVSVFEEASDK